MSNTRYLEVDSTYRDRTRWPLPGQFEIPISQTGRKLRGAALDPVSEAMPIATWTSNAFATTPAQSVTGTIAAVAGANNIGSTNGNITFIITTTGQILQTIDDYYLKAIITDTTITEQRRIEEYTYIGPDAGGNDRAKITVDYAFGSTFADGDAFSISDPTDLSQVQAPLFFVPDGLIAKNAYVGYLLYNETQNEYRTIIRYDYDTHILGVDTSTDVTGWTITDTYSIRAQIPSLVTTVSGVATTQTIPLATGSSENDFYNNYFIRMTSGNAQNEVRLITDYDASLTSVSIATRFTFTPADGDTLEILPFSYDNLNPFNYTGSTVSQSQEVCYEIELLNLVLPNENLVSTSGARIAFYPYVYVQLSNESSAGAGNTGIIYSNNPNATKMLFRAAIDDVPNPLISSFIKVDGDGMVQTIKFKPNDNLMFSVTLPDGTVYETTEEETYSPEAPNPRIQISAVFGLRRLVS